MIRETGISRPVGEDYVATYKDLARGGIQTMEIAPWGWQHDKNKIDMTKVVAAIHDAGIRINSYHMRFYDHEYCNISAADEHERTETVKAHSEIMRRMANLGVKIFTLHPGNEPLPTEDREYRKDQSKKSLYSLAQLAKELDVRIAVEDLPRLSLGNTSVELKELISVDDTLCICFDVNHLLKEDHVEFINRLGDKIITTHISDYDFIDERHLMPGEGKINWPVLMEAFDKIGYRGVINYETHYGPLMEKYNMDGYNLGRILVRNHELLEAKKIPTHEDYKDLGIEI